MLWYVTTDRNGNRHYVEAGGNMIIWSVGNFGRNRWTVLYPNGDYGMMTNTLGEAKSWAELNA